jgi:hypothetical protein
MPSSRSCPLSLHISAARVFLAAERGPTIWSSALSIKFRHETMKAAGVEGYQRVLTIIPSSFVSSDYYLMQ